MNRFKYFLYALAIFVFVVVFERKFKNTLRTSADSKACIDNYSRVSSTLCSRYFYNDFKDVIILKDIFTKHPEIQINGKIIDSVQIKLINQKKLRLTVDNDLQFQEIEVSITRKKRRAFFGQNKFSIYPMFQNNNNFSYFLYRKLLEDIFHVQLPRMKIVLIDFGAGVGLYSIEESINDYLANMKIIGNEIGMKSNSDYYLKRILLPWSNNTNAIKNALTSLVLGLGGGVPPVHFDLYQFNGIELLIYPRETAFFRPACAWLTQIKNGDSLRDKLDATFFDAKKILNSKEDVQIYREAFIEFRSDLYRGIGNLEITKAQIKNLIQDKIIDENKKKQYFELIDQAFQGLRANACGLSILEGLIF